MLLRLKRSFFACFFFIYFNSTDQSHAYFCTHFEIFLYQNKTKSNQFLTLLLIRFCSLSGRSVAFGRQIEPVESNQFFNTCEKLNLINSESLLGCRTGFVRKPDANSAQTNHFRPPRYHPTFALWTTSELE